MTTRLGSKLEKRRNAEKIFVLMTDDSYVTISNWFYYLFIYFIIFNLSVFDIRL